MKPRTLNPLDLEKIVAALVAAAAAREQMAPLRTRADEALRRSRELLSLPIYPYDSSPPR